MAEHAVVIAGGGPTGLMLAAELALAQVDVVIVERRADSGSRPRPGRRSARAHHRGARSARRRRPVSRAGQGDADPGIRPNPAGHQRLPGPPQLRARAAADSDRAPAGCLGRRARRADHARARGDRVHPGRHRRRRRAVRRHVDPGGLPGRVRRRPQCDPEGGRHRVRRVGSIDELAHGRGRDGREAGVRTAPWRWDRPGRGRRPDYGRPDRTPGRAHQRAHSAGCPRRTHRHRRDGLRRAQPELDFPFYRQHPAGGVVSPGAHPAGGRRRPRASPRSVVKVSTPASRMR